MAPGKRERAAPAERLSAGVQHDAAAAVRRVQAGGEDPLADPVRDRPEQGEVHPADQLGVGAGQRVEGQLAIVMLSPSRRGS